MTDEIYIEALHENDAASVTALIRRNLADYDETETVLVATFRRLSNLNEIYSHECTQFYVAKDRGSQDAPVACIGIGNFHGLPPSEGVGEIRDLVVEERYRGRGLGSKLLHLCIADAKKFGYKKLYLETSKHMKIAQRLFTRTGFRPVTEKRELASKEQKDHEEKDLPSYFLMEDL